MTIQRLTKWFRKAFPTPTARIFNVQTGVHFEEVAEMLEALEGVDDKSRARLANVHEVISAFANDLKAGEITVETGDRCELLDAICDQIVTASGVAYQAGFDLDGAINEVAASNESKFDSNGNPILNAQGKIMKGPDYFIPELAAYLGFPAKTAATEPGKEFRNGL